MTDKTDAMPPPLLAHAALAPIRGDRASLAVARKAWDILSANGGKTLKDKALVQWVECLLALAADR